MSDNSCFVIMAIGDQDYSGQRISSAELKSRYDDLIKEAIKKARPSLDVIRADEVSAPGTITTDIVTRIMHSRYVIADVTYPNPNVFYELGLRHASKPGTIIIRDSSGPKIPFDIAHLRYVEYDNTASGLKALATRLGEQFSFMEGNSQKPDNHFLEMAKLTNFEFPSYGKDDKPLELKIIMEAMKSPELVQLISRQSSGEAIPTHELMRILGSSPVFAELFISKMLMDGSIKF
ncbi:hypothetical protein [Lysobacter brunescens]|uniref:Nucleoside 2-deoxyribosyltransferase n=1 Tax=Lysobacter brunescens TaxID=262323 RepID=A0ABW2YHB7_9GAMM